MATTTPQRRPRQSRPARLSRRERVTRPSVPHRHPRVTLCHAPHPHPRPVRGQTAAHRAWHDVVARGPGVGLGHRDGHPVHRPVHRSVRRDLGEAAAPEVGEAQRAVLVVVRSPQLDRLVRCLRHQHLQPDGESGAGLRLQLHRVRGGPDASGLGHGLLRATAGESAGIVALVLARRPHGLLAHPAAARGLLWRLVLPADCPGQRPGPRFDRLPGRRIPGRGRSTTTRWRRGPRTASLAASPGWRRRRATGGTRCPGSCAPCRGLWRTSVRVSPAAGGPTPTCRHLARRSLSGCRRDGALTASPDTTHA